MKLLGVVTGRVQFQLGRVSFKMALGRELCIYKTCSPGIGHQRALPHWMTPHTHQLPPILILKVDLGFCPWLYFQFCLNRKQPLLSLFFHRAEAGELVGLVCREGVSCIHSGLYFTAFPAGNLTLPFFRLRGSLFPDTSPHTLW